MIKYLSDKDAKALEGQINDLGPTHELVAVYSVNQLHCAWVRVIDKKGEFKKGNK
jgi:hypothetical protein